MGLRFRKSFKIAPGVRINVSNKSTGISFGGNGMRHSINSSGRKTTTVGIPGTGLSYVSSSGGSRNYKSAAYNRNAQLKRQQREAEKLQALERARLEVALFQNQVELLKSIHKECDDVIDWNRIAREPAPFQPGEKGPAEVQAAQKLEKFKPNFFQKLFNGEEKAEGVLRNEMETGRIQDQKAFQEWEEKVELARNILVGNLDTYFRVIEEMRPFDDLAEFGSGFEFFAGSPKLMDIHFNVNGSHIVPTEEKSLTQTGKVSVKKMTKTKYYDIYQDYVCSCTIRIARDLFALLPLNYVIINAYDEKLDTATGHINRGCILSVKIEKHALNKLNFEYIDCSDAVESFEHRMVFKKTAGFSFVEEL